MLFVTSYPSDIVVVTHGLLSACQVKRFPQGRNKCLNRTFPLRKSVKMLDLNIDFSLAGRKEAAREAAGVQDDKTTF